MFRSPPLAAILDQEEYTRTVLGIEYDTMLAYWPRWDKSFGIAEDVRSSFDCEYHASARLSRPGIGDGRSSAIGVMKPSIGVFDAFATSWSADYFTIALWMNPPSSWLAGGNSSPLFFDGSGSEGFLLWHPSTFSAILAQRSSIAATANSLTIAGWTHLAVTFAESSQELKIFINGLEAGVASSDHTNWVTPMSSSISAAIGGYSWAVPGVNPFNYEVAHVSIWNKPLTSDQIATLAVRPV